MKPIQIQRRTLRFVNGHAQQLDDHIVTEYPLTIKLNGEEFVTMVCTPEYIEDLVIGYLASEGIIKSSEEIQELWVQEQYGFVHVKTARNNPIYRQFQNKRYITSCCGASRQGFVFFQDAVTAKKINSFRVKISIEDTFRLMEEMQKAAKVFQLTGGVHNAALGDASGLILTRMDIGRHNALDKIYGHCLKNNIAMKDKVVVFSGRISSEILLKVAKLGCEIVLSKSAPTELALKLAEQLGITIIGFIRQGTLNVYTYPERLLDL